MFLYPHFAKEDIEAQISNLPKVVQLLSVNARIEM